MPAVAAATVFLFAGGVFVIILGWVGTPEQPKRRSDSSMSSQRRPQLIRLVGSVILGVIVALFTGWMGLLFAVPAVAYSLSGMYEDRQRREFRLRRLGAIASWLEMMRDTIVAGAGISSAVHMTARRAPTLIAGEVRRLGVRLESTSFSNAIIQFGDELDVPEADSGIAALAMASQSAGGNLGELLSVVVESIRRQVEQRSRIEALRVRFLTSASLMVAVTVATSAMVLGTSSQLRVPYHSFLGQLILVLVGCFYAIAIAVLRRMGRPEESVRLIAAVSA